MAGDNRPKGWNRITRLFHWGMALCILIEVPAGFIMSQTYRAKDPVGMAWHWWASNVHHSGGLILLALAFARVGWRLLGPVPPAPIAAITPVVRRAAHGTHWLLYALLILIPLSGWAALSSLADSAAFGQTILWFFGQNGFEGIVPRIVPPLPWDSKALLSFMLFAQMHFWLVVVGGCLLILHIAAALRHHFLLRDATLRRMLGRN